VDEIAGREPGPVEGTTGGHPLRGLLTAQAIGAFNDNAWKGLVVFLPMAAAAGETQGQEHTAVAQMVLMVPLMVMSLPGGVLADRVSKRSVLVALKVLELALMLVGTAVLVREPRGGPLALAILALFGVQAALFSPAKYGILPEILPLERLSSGNGLLEMSTNLAVLGGTVAGGGLVWAARGLGEPIWLGGLVLTALSAFGLLAALTVPRVPAARAEGGLATTVRLAWESIRSDRVLRLAVIGQILVWAVASLVPPPISAYGSKVLNLNEMLAGLPLAALGIGIGVGCLFAGWLSASKVEYGLLPLGALGLSACTLAFAIIGPGLAGTMVLMALMGIFSGCLFVPLNALLQWRSPADRRGAVIATTNVLVFAGMLLGSALAWALARGGFSARETFLGASIALAGGFLWALSLVPEAFLRFLLLPWPGIRPDRATKRLVPEAFLRFLLLSLAHTIYRVRILGRENIPREGGALMISNHVSFVDGLFIMASTDRPVRFVVYAPYFNRPIIGRLLRAMKAIPISPSGGPKMILHAFREAGRALDEGELVCLFPEGQLTRTGMMAPFQRGLQRIVKGRTAPIIPLHLDRLMGSIFSPASHRLLPERIPYPVTVSIGRPLPPESSLAELRQAITELGERAWAHRKAARRPLHHEFIRRARRHPWRLALADAQTPRLSYLGALAGALALARALRPRWGGQANVGILLPSSVGGSLVNLAATLAGKVVVNLNFTAGRAGMESAAAQAGLRTVVTSRAFLEKAKLEPPAGAEIIFLEDVLAGLGRAGRAGAAALALLAPVRWLERLAGASRTVTVDDTATVIFSSGSTGEPKGVILSHFNIDSNVQGIREAYRVLPTDRLIGILPPFHSFGYTMFWFAAHSGMASVCHPSPLDAARIGELVQEYRVTVLMATPTFLQLYLRRCPPAEFGSLRLVLAGAEKLPEALALSFEDGFGIRPMEGYGMTECAPVVAVNTFDHREPGFFQPGSRRGYVGRPLPGVAVRVVHPETFEPLGPDTEGLVLVKGPNVMRGYLGRDDLTAAASHDGWYITGDLGLLSEDGFLKISGRLSRFSKIGGEMVPHGRVEEALQRAVGADAQVFAVTAVGDERKGESLAVLHTLDDQQVTRALAGLGAAGLPNLFIPRRDHFIKVDAIPMLGTGKLDLKAIRRTAEEALAGAAPSD
jgi:acyl-[acyl-carrier-protein]-phospholipid O-acyltransferase/long-chain-fatty-acid--[acyl-carrier-protein] ligase